MSFLTPANRRPMSSSALPSTLRLRARGVTKLFDTTVALWQVDATGEAGSMLLVQGPNGCGKSTLLRLLAGLMTPTSGEIRWEHPRGAAPLVAYVGHQNGLYDALTPLEHLLLSARLTRSDPSRGLELLTRLGVGSVAGQPCGTLSMGTRRRVALARAIATPADVLLIDEPLAALDDRAAATTLDLLAEATGSGRLVVVAAPTDLRLRALADDVLSLSSGRMLRSLADTPRVSVDAH